jgi:carbon-monoxide dehydrogenase medium subunit
MHDFDYLEPTTLPEVCQLMAQWGDEARLMAGGTALMLALRQRLVSPSRLVSVAGVPELRGIHVGADQGVSIGAFTTHSEVAQSSHIQQHYPMLSSMASQVANWQVRNQGTIGGNLCYADPATDPPGCLLALGAEVVLQGPVQQRVLPMSAFLVDYYETALQADEVLVAIRLPPPQAHTRGSYLRHLKTSADHRPLVNVSITSSQNGHAIDQVCLVVGASTPFPVSLPSAQVLVGQDPSLSLFESVAQAAAQEIDALSDARASADYRREVVRVLVARALSNHFNLSRI